MAPFDKPISGRSLGTSGPVNVLKESDVQAQLAAHLARGLAKDPDLVTKTILESLNARQRQVLLGRLCDVTLKASNEPSKCPRIDGRGPGVAPGQGEAGPEGHIPEPRMGSLLTVAFSRGLPFVGFGFLDNFIMIMAGDEIDAVFGARLGLSTMASAGLGNLFADVAGISFANSIEQYVRRLSWLKDPTLTPVQMNLRSVHVAKWIGAALGVMIGCTIGLTPLLFKGKRVKEDASQAPDGGG